MWCWDIILVKQQEQLVSTNKLKIVWLQWHGIKEKTSWPLWYKRWMFSCTLSFSEWPQLKPGITSKIDQHFLWKYYTFVKRQVLQNLEEFSLRGEEGIYGGCKFLEFLVDSIPETRIWGNVCCFSSSSFLWTVTVHKYNICSCCSKSAISSFIQWQ